MESTVSQGNVRAKTSEREPVEGEVKANVINSKGDSLIVRVVTSSAKAKELGIKDGDKVEIKISGYTAVKGDRVFFKPEAKEGNAWKANSVSSK
jgi:translation initiation factor IF-1